MEICPSTVPQSWHGIYAKLTDGKRSELVIDAFRTLGFVGGQQLAGEQHAAGGEGKLTQ